MLELIDAFEGCMDLFVVDLVGRSVILLGGRLCVVMR